MVIGAVWCPSDFRSLKQLFKNLKERSNFLFLQKKKETNRLQAPQLKKKNFFFKISRSSARCFGRCPPRFFLHATDIRGPEHSEEKIYEVYILFGLSWSAVSIGTGAASYKQFCPGESNF